METFNFLLFTIFSLGTLIGFLFLWKKLTQATFTCSKCGYSYTPLLYKPTIWTFGFQFFFYRFYTSLFLWLPVFFGKIFYRCQNCKKFSWHSLEGPRKGFLYGGIAVHLGILLVIFFFIRLLLS